MAEEYNQEGIDALVNTGRPIPGQSLTEDPDNSYPWEGPPEYTDFRKAFNYIAEELLEEEVYVPLVVAMGQGVPISDITLQILQRGFQEGKWNPDLFMMLLEPLMYFLLALAEKAAIKILLTALTKAKIGDMSKVPEGVLPADIVEDIEELEMPESLLAPDNNTEQPSLLAKSE